MAHPLTTTYRRSAYPRMGITLERVLREPALLATLELRERMAARIARRYVGAGRRMEVTAQ
ncbi:MAG: hypothetical protein H3C27_15665 [Opitutaceae bacterium]|nr:hypothetical protein [Opitutaceae bacterium]